MSIFLTFSKRQKAAERAGKPDVYRYDDLPAALRVQIAHIWRSTIGPYFQVDHWQATPLSNQLWQAIHDAMAREVGVFQLGTKTKDMNPWLQCQEFLLNQPVELTLDMVEVSFSIMANRAGLYPGEDQRTQDPDSAVAELNYRLREHGVGYQLVAGRIIKVDSEYVHAEVVQGALSLLRDSRFRGAEEEFLRAHEHYRHGRTKEAIAEALKAFESTMKSICDKRRWTYSHNATAKSLLDVLFAQGLIPQGLQAQFSALRGLLESGVPSIRNRMGGHGQGSDPVSVPDYVAAFALHNAAANMVFLMEANRNI
ncbi:MAG: hypothetical protein WEB04_01370 [Dehalococcoidia bacterium]